MAEFTGVGLGVQTPDMMGKLSQILSVRAQQQALRGQKAEVEGAEQTQRQRAGIAHYMATKLPKYTLEDGTIDLASISSDPDLYAVAGDKTTDVLDNLAAVKDRQVTARQSLFNLDQAKRKGVIEVTTALLSDPDVAANDPQDPQIGEKSSRAKQKLNDALTQYYDVHGKDVLPAIAAYKSALDNAPPGGMSNVLKTMQLGAISAEQQIAAQKPQLVSTGGRLTNVAPTAIPIKDVPLSLPPGVYQDASGAQFEYKGGRLVPLGTGGGSPSQSPAAPTKETRKFVQPVPQQKELEEHVSTVRKADSDYGTNRHVNDELLRLSADTATGPGSALWHTGALGKITGTFGGNAAADYQKISAYLDRQAALSSQQMGLPDTNAGLQTAANLSGTTEYTPEALQTKVKLTDAMVEGAHQYRKGLDKVIGTGPNQDLASLQTFRGQWADNFDPNIFRVENAIRRGDTEELSQLKQELGARGMAELKKKSENLRKLERGELLNE